MSSSFDKTIPLKYLGLPLDYTPDPNDNPIDFLKIHMGYLPPHILAHFSSVTSPKQRTQLPSIRNRRLHYLNTKPTELGFTQARLRWPDIWEGRERLGEIPAKEECDWALHEFLKDAPKHIGKLGSLLAGYEEERESERIRIARRGAAQKAEDDFIPEEDDDDSDDDVVTPAPETDAEKKEIFERRIRERFIYGLLMGADYDKVDWDESMGEDDDREAEDRWFDEDDDDDEEPEEDDAKLDTNTGSFA